MDNLGRTAFVWDYGIAAVISTAGTLFHAVPPSEAIDDVWRGRHYSRSLPATAGVAVGGGRGSELASAASTSPDTPL